MNCTYGLTNVLMREGESMHRFLRTVGFSKYQKKHRINELIKELAASALGQKGRFAVLGFKLVNTSEWTPDESLEIWDGGL